jgi:hypothetical protein
VQVHFAFMDLNLRYSYDSGDLWTAKWWSENDVPGGKRKLLVDDVMFLTPVGMILGTAGDWTEDGAC